MDADPKEMTEAEILAFAKAHLGQAVLLTYRESPEVQHLWELHHIEHKRLYGHKLTQVPPWLVTPMFAVRLGELASIASSNVTAAELAERRYEEGLW